MQRRRCTSPHPGMKRASRPAGNRSLTSTGRPLNGVVCDRKHRLSGRTPDLFPDMPCMKRVYRDKKASVHWSAARKKKSASRLGDKPLTNRLSTTNFVPAFGLHRILLVRASGETFRRRVFDALGGTRDACLLGVLFCRRPVHSIR